MCGIFGRFSPGESVGDLGALCAATDLIAHRGPDDGAYFCDGRFFLGHRRLSIIDLAHGAQPMATPDGRYVVVFNGEIYNYKELRAELIADGIELATSSDTEVLLHGYRRWGRDLPRHLVGMFAFAIADRRERSLFLARDRFGEKPLLLAETDASLTFASELAPLVALPGQPREIDQEALVEYLCLNYVPGARTLVRGIRRLLPGHWLLYGGNGERSSGAYWEPPRDSLPGRPPSLDDATRELGERLDRSVRIAMRSDVPIALFLSGGIDSSAVAESAVRQGILKHAYCLELAEEGFSELPNAQRVASKLGLELRRVELGAGNLVDFGKLVEHADDPLADSSALPVFTLARGVARDYKVAISGDGGDELFGGYLTYKATVLHARWIAGLPLALRRGLARAAAFVPAGDAKVPLTYKLMRFLRAADLSSGEAHFTWNGTWLPKDALGLLRSPDGVPVPELSARHGLSSHPSLLDLQRADATDYLPNDILAKVDRMTMAHGLEARAPLLIPEVAEYALSLPASLKLGAFGPPKRILRHLVSERLGPEIGRARKQGFSIPVHRWLRGPLRGTLEDLLAPAAVDRLGLLDPGAVERAKRRHLTGEAQLGWELWGLMVLVAWFRVRIEKPPSLRAPSSLRRVELPELAADVLPERP
jgi:asparagine synthase (glutamine-hydrolysing)